MATDKRELYKTATIARSGSVFAYGEIVGIKVKYRTEQGYIYECRLGHRVANYAEGFLKDFCL